MPVTDDYDELLARADDWLSTDTEDDEANRLVRALRAALAARPQPLFEGTVGDLLVDPRFQGKRIVAYEAGSATPTGHDSFGLNITKADLATPTGDDDE